MKCYQIDVEGLFGALNAATKQTARDGKERSVKLSDFATQL